MVYLLKKIIFLIVFFRILIPAHSQTNSKKEFISVIKDADNYFYFDEDYERASLLYESLHNIYPDNCNISAKLGICYLNLDGKKDEAIELLLIASKNIAENDKDYVEFGEKAPLDTYLYLAVAYHMNDSLNKALTLYSDLKKKQNSSEIFREKYLDMQIRNCKYAIEMQKNPSSSTPELFAPWLDQFPGASNPVISKNDSVFVFTQKINGKTHIFCSYKNINWRQPLDITSQLGKFDQLYTNSITGDGRLLIIFYDDGGNGNLFYSQRNENEWSKLKPFPKNINTIYWESHGFISLDGKTIYFSSNRPGGEGELDIWKSEKTIDGTWGKSTNCGKIINTPYNENTPYYDPESGTLLFSSVGHTGMGGYDVFRSVLANGSWSSPIGIPYEFNTTSDNTFFIMSNNTQGYITSLLNESGVRNIYEIKNADSENGIITVEGNIKLQDGMDIDPEVIIAELFESKKNTLLKTIHVSEDGKFQFESKSVEYHVIVNYPNYQSDTIFLSNHANFQSHYISVNSTLIPQEVVSGSFMSINNILFEFDSDFLDKRATANLEQLKSILVDNTELKIEVAGYTDSKGSSTYNRKLSDKRAQRVIDYLISAGISSSRLVKKAYGASNFYASNTLSNGSDNPEGRKYNRRVTFGIVDTHTGVIISQEAYTPAYLKQPYSMRYCIILAVSSVTLDHSYFNKLKMNDILFIKSTRIDDLNLYSLGVFNNKTDAIKYLSSVRENGFEDAYIVNLYDLNNESRTILNPVRLDNKKLYTIQLRASRSPLNMKTFIGIEGVEEVRSNDRYFRYLYGEYSLYSKAKEELVIIHESGFKDAFIRDKNLLINQ